MFTRTFEYDKKGNLSARVFTFDFDSQNPDTDVRTDTVTRTYDKRGDLVRHFQERDDDNDGVDRTITFIFTYNNDRTRATLVFETDTDADGTRNNVWNYVYTHSKEGKLRFTRLFGEFDADNDGGPPDTIDDAIWTFNARGDTLRFTDLFDFTNDGVLNFLTIVDSFSANGVRFLREQTLDDMDDGSDDETRVTRYYYDQHGNLVLFVEEIDDLTNGVGVDTVIRTTRVY